MLYLKISLLLLLALVVRAEKKIELQDIEEDNLKSEQKNDLEPIDAGLQDRGPAHVPVNVLKPGFPRYFHGPVAQQQPRYIQQYDVTEPPAEEPNAHQAFAGYISNVPIEIYLVPHYHNEAQEPARHQPVAPQYSAPAASNVATYQTAPEVLQTQTNYVQVPTYMKPTGKTIIQQQYSEPVAYFSYTSHPTNTHHTQLAHPTAAPAAYQTPVVQYTSLAQHVPSKEYPHHDYQNEQYRATNAVEEIEETVQQTPHHFPSHTEVIYRKAPKPDHTQLYSSHTSLRNDYHNKHIAEVPHTSQVIYQSPVQQVPHIPKALPLQRPLFSKVYSSGDPLVSQAFTRRPPEPYGPPFKRRPTSLLDSYIPSSVQVEYMKRGFARTPQEAYEALSSVRHEPRQFERGFLPNQMYHTAAGGITFGHYKRSPK